MQPAFIMGMTLICGLAVVTIEIRRNRKDTSRRDEILSWAKRYLAADICPSLVHCMEDAKQAAKAADQLMSGMYHYWKIYSIPDTENDPAEEAGVFMTAYLAWFFKEYKDYRKYYQDVYRIFLERCAPVVNRREQA